MNERDFKGIWIPKEIWLNKDLSPLDRVILAEIDSLDNENHCTASNEYFAEFFGVSVATITRSIKKLKDMNFINCKMVSSDTGNYRVIKMTRGGSNQNDERGIVKMSTNYNSNNNKTYIVSKDTMSEAEFDFGCSDNKRKPNLYEKCVTLINNYTQDTNLRGDLKEYLQLLLDKSRNERKPFYANQFKGMLGKLDEFQNKHSVVRQSIIKGYIGFFPVFESSNSAPISNPDTNKSVQVKANKNNLSKKEY